jgi:hypothetical protein
MANGFNGNWVIDHNLSSPQKPLLVAMGKPKWQIGVVDDAEEDFELFCDVKTNKTGKQFYVFTKNVRMFLNSTFLSVVSKLFSIPFNEIKYNHVFEANGRPFHHENDKKDFGICDSITTYNAVSNTFTIRWQLRYGLLIATHSLPHYNQFRIDMILKRLDKPDITVHKIYNRKIN